MVISLYGRGKRMGDSEESRFKKMNQQYIDSMAADDDLASMSQQVFNRMCKYQYSYHFNWLGRPIIQFPQDIIAVQEIIWDVKPDLVVETGVARGGSLILSASILELIGGAGKVIGIDIEIRQHNRVAIENHPLSHRIDLLEGSSTDVEIVSKVAAEARGKKVLVLLDSNHTHQHVLTELELYSPLVQKSSYLIVFDTIIEEMPEDSFPDRPWGKGNNPKTAVNEFLERNDRFILDTDFEKKLVITVAPGGYLKCVKD
jgi:cephalosporin hydroxylase